MQVKTVVIIEGVSNIVMMIAKLVVGVMTNSSAIIGDALHSFTDLANNVIALVVIRISEKPSDDAHHYGHRKFEQLAVFALAVLLAVVAIELALNALKNYARPVEQSFLGLQIMLLTLVINVGLTTWEHYWAKRLDSDLLSADSKHTLSDVLTTIAIIAGWQLAALGYYWLDAVFALFVAGVIFYMAIHLFQKAVPILVDHSDRNPAELMSVVQNIKQVESVRQIRARSAYGCGWADVVITVDPSLSIDASHNVTEDIERALKRHFGIDDVVVHVEPS